MKVKAIHKPFRKNEIGQEFELPAHQAKVLIRLNRVEAAEGSSMGYQTRMLTAEPGPVVAPAEVQYTSSEPVEDAPYGYKADGTPRKRPGRSPAASE